MRKTFVLLAFVSCLAGCAAPGGHPSYGNFLQADPAVPDQQKLAADAVQQLSTLYPPAQTHVELRQPTPDPFGQALAQALRDKGYALLESGAASAPAAPDSLSLHYVLDTASTGLYRLTLQVGADSLSRAYRAQDGAFAAAGDWVRRTQ